MKLYELAYLLKPELSQEELRQFSQKFLTFIESKGGIFDSQTPPAKKQLAYPIKKRGNVYQSAYFGTIQFSANPESIPEILQTIKSEGEIIRYLLCTKKEKVTAAKILKLRREKPIIFPKKPKAPKVELEKLEEKLEELLKE